MGALLVVVLLPFGDLGPDMSQRRERCFVEALVAEAAIEAFNETVLQRLSRRAVMPFDMCLLAPPENRHRGQFGAVIRDNGSGPSTTVHDRIEFSRNTQTRKGGVGHQCQAFTCEVVDYGQNTKPPSISERIADEIEAPPFVGP